MEVSQVLGLLLVGHMQERSELKFSWWCTWLLQDTVKIRIERSDPGSQLQIHELKGGSECLLTITLFTLSQNLPLESPLILQWTFTLSVVDLMFPQVLFYSGWNCRGRGKACVIFLFGSSSGKILQDITLQFLLCFSILLKCPVFWHFVPKNISTSLLLFPLPHSSRVKTLHLIWASHPPHCPSKYGVEKRTIVIYQFLTREINHSYFKNRQLEQYFHWEE